MFDENGNKINVELKGVFIVLGKKYRKCAMEGRPVA